MFGVDTYYMSADHSISWVEERANMQITGKTSEKKDRCDNPKLVKLPFAWKNGDEATMVAFKGRSLIVGSSRLNGGRDIYLSVQDLYTG